MAQAAVAGRGAGGCREGGWALTAAQGETLVLGKEPEASQGRGGKRVSQPGP